MTRDVSPNRKGLTHAESKAQTRARLIAVGRKHFLEHGFDKAVADDITKEAGYTRGALYSNFGSKEGLLLEVARASHRLEMARYEAIAAKHSGKRLITGMRDTLASSLDSPDNLLLTEFEIEAFRNKTLHDSFFVLREEVATDGLALLTRVLRENPTIDLEMDPRDFVVALGCFRRGLLIGLPLSKSDAYREQGREIMLDFFNRYGLREKTKARKQKGLAQAPAKQKRPKPLRDTK